MTPEQARQLLGGLAAGILSPEERRTLFEAALHDQTLFNEVAGELEFAAFLQSPDTRAQLANRIEVEPQRRPWWSLRPAWLALSGALAASLVVYVAVSHRPVEVPVARVARNDASLASPPKPAIPPPLVPDAAPKQPAPPAREAAARVMKKAPVPETPKSLSAGTLTQPAPPPIPQPAMAAPRAMAFQPMRPPPTASLSGTVRDQSGAAVSGAKIDIVNTVNNSTTHATTDRTGQFVAPALEAGEPYTVTAEALGFKKAERSVTLESNQSAQLDIPLQVGPVADSVQVAAPAPAAPPSQTLPQVAVLDFANGAQPNRSGAQVADQLSSQLLSSGHVGVIARDKVQQAALNQPATGHPPSAQEAAAVGRSVGADAVIVGSIQPPDRPGAPPKNVAVKAQVVDTKQARPLATVAARGSSLQLATASLGNQIQSKLAKPLEGSVTRRDGNIVSVKFAEAAGLQIGARCAVIRGLRKIGELVITSVNGQSAFGKFEGDIQPRTGDRVTTLISPPK